MGYKIVKTDAFQRDLDGVIAYIALSLENRTAAASMLDAVEKCYGDLERMPLMYEACRDPYLNALGYRSMKWTRRPNRSRSCAFFMANRIMRS